MESRSGAPSDPLTRLERVAQALEQELAGWRRRCMKAEAELEEARGRIGPVGSGDAVGLRQRLVELEAEKQALTARILMAREQIEQLRTRLRFVEEQVAGDRT